MTKLNQIIAIEKGEKSRAHSRISEVYKKAQKPALYAGMTRTYTPRDDDGDALPQERGLVQERVSDSIAEFEDAMTRLLDITATKDWANCEARADVLVDGQVLIAQAPVSFLLFLEKQLTDIRTFLGKLPTLDPSHTWHEDPNTGLYRTDSVRTTRTKKVPKNHVKAEATEHHPAQVEVFYEDVIIGTWDKVDFSGAIPERQQRAYLDRVERLLNAVKYAREEANGHEVTDVRVAQGLFAYLFRS